MAKQANAQNVAADDRGPDYDAAIGVIQKIMATEEDAKKKRGPIKGLYEEIDNLRVDRDSARAMKALLKLQPDNRTMFLRGYFGLLIAAKDMLDLPGDMVDMMHKAIPEHLHVESVGSVKPKASGTKNKKKAAPAEDTDDGGDENENGGPDDDAGEGLAADHGAPLPDEEDEFDRADPARLAQVPDVMDQPAGTA